MFVSYKLVGRYNRSYSHEHVEDVVSDRKTFERDSVSSYAMPTRILGPSVLKKKDKQSK